MVERREEQFSRKEGVRVHGGPTEQLVSAISGKRCHLFQKVPKGSSETEGGNFTLAQSADKTSLKVSALYVNR